MRENAIWPLLLLIAIEISNGSKIEFTTTPNDILEGATQTFTVSCSIKDTVLNETIKTGSDYVSTSENLVIVNSIIIRKVNDDNPKDVVRIVTGQAAVAGPDFVTGKITGNMTQGQPGNLKHLTISWNLPSYHLAGHYTCEINAADLEGDNLKFRSNSTTNSLAATIQDLISSVAQTRQEIINRPVVRFEDGIIFSLDSHTWDVTHDDVREKYVDVQFTKAYQNVPNINLIVFGLDTSGNVRYWASVQSATTTGFKILLATYGDTLIVEIKIHWFSIGT